MKMQIEKQLIEALKEIEKLCYGKIDEGMHKRMDRIAELARKSWKDAEA